MGRPRSDQGPAAVTRLETAFFDELRTTPFQELTISAIVRSAGVNRNSFYYHYADLDDLAHSAVSGLLISEIPRLIASGFAPESEQFDQLLIDAVEDGNLMRMLIITGPNSTSLLRDILKDAVIDLWLDVFQLERSDLNVQEISTVHFVLAGGLELLAKAATRDPLDTIEAPDMLEALEAIRGLPIVQAIIRITADSLNAAAARAATRPTPDPVGESERSWHG